MEMAKDHASTMYLDIHWTFYIFEYNEKESSQSLIFYVLCLSIFVHGHLYYGDVVSFLLFDKGPFTRYVMAIGGKECGRFCYAERYGNFRGGMEGFIGAVT